jgi:hypothetical protein
MSEVEAAAIDRELLGGYPMVSTIQTTVAELRVRSEGRLEELEASTAVCRAFLACLNGDGPQPRVDLLDGLEARTADAAQVLGRLAEREPSSFLDEALAQWSASRAALDHAATQRLDALKLPRPDSFEHRVRDACATLVFEFDRPVSSVTSEVLGVFPHLVVAGFAGWAFFRFVAGRWSTFPGPEMMVLAIAMSWNVWAKWRRRRVPEAHVRVTVFGVHAEGGFTPFDDITTAWVGRLGEVVIETRRRERVHLRTSRAVELQLVLMRHGVQLTTTALVAP